MNWKTLREEPVTFLREGLKRYGLYGPPRRVLLYWLLRLKGEETAKVWIHGSYMNLNLKDMGAQLELFLRETREDKATETFRKWLCPNLTVMEVGAHVGYYALQEARHGCNVIALEPDPTSFATLSKNIRLNGYTSVSLHNIAAGKKKGTLRFIQNGISNWRRMSYDGSGSLVKVCTVDSLSETTKIDVIRMDVEGFELEVLKGSLNTLRVSRPKLFIEVHKDLIPLFGGTQEELFNLLSEFDYQITHCFVGGSEGPKGPAKGYDYKGTSAHVFLESG